MTMNSDRGKMPTSSEMAVHLPENKVAASLENGGTMTMPSARRLDRKADVLHVTLRLLCMVTSVIALSFMVTARQSGDVFIFGFMLPVHSKWSFSNSFEYLVAVSGAVAGHSLLLLLISMSRLLAKSPVIPSRSHAWLIFAGDQIFAYAMMSAGSAASGVTNLNHVGVKHTALPNFCKPLKKFCDHVAISIAFTFFSCFLLAVAAVQEVLWLSKSKH